MENRFFSMIIVPDSGRDVKTGSFTGKFFIGVFSALIITFLLCLFFIIGYHIKLVQEKDYKTAVSIRDKHLRNIDSSLKLLEKMNLKLREIHRNDQAFRLYALMNTLPDRDMYNAGIGGHVMVDTSEFADFSNDLKVKLTDLFTGVSTLESRINVQERSFNEIQSNLSRNRDIIDNTPTIIPTPNSFRITCKFGWRTHPIGGYWHMHDAIDLGGNVGDPIQATADGVVESAEYQGNLGRCIRIRHKYGYETLYGHLQMMKVKEGDIVKKGDIIGIMGRTGRTTGTHLHYGIIYLGEKKDPLPMFINSGT
ncbi:M23 family metallopeptidase [bacterium]|nr:M23 family metallopeptidase [bacterium]